MKDLGNKQIMSKNLKRLMAEKPVTAKKLSKDLEFPYTTLLSWIKAENYPRIDKIEAMAGYFGVMKSDLIENKVMREMEEQPEEMAEKHFEMITDEDMNDIFDDFQYLDALERKMVKDLVHSLAGRKKTEA